MHIQTQSDVQACSRSLPSYCTSVVKMQHWAAEFTSSSEGPAFGPGRVNTLILKPVRLHSDTSYAAILGTAEQLEYSDSMSSCVQVEAEDDSYSLLQTPQFVFQTLFPSTRH